MVNIFQQYFGLVSFKSLRGNIAIGGMYLKITIYIKQWNVNYSKNQSMENRK